MVKVDFVTGLVIFYPYLPNGQGYMQVILLTIHVDLHIHLDKEVKGPGQAKYESCSLPLRARWNSSFES